MTPLDLRSKEEWEGILDRVATDANMTACLMDEAGALLFCRYDRYPLCAAIRANQDATTFICSQTNTVMLATVEKTRQPAVDFCEAGLIRLVVPILHGDEMVGQVTACGLAVKDEEPDAFLVAKQLGISEEEVLHLAESTPFGSEDEVRQFCTRLFDELNSS
jgi:ligand-binding sensor protein